MTAVVAAWALAAGAIAQDGAQPAAGASFVAGVWRGEWHDDGRGHHGPMTARIRPRGDGTYRAVFTGRFAAIIPFRYGTTLRPVEADGAAAFSGTRSLGPFGTFAFSGTATATDFAADYTANRWRGRFTMQRVR